MFSLILLTRRADYNPENFELYLAVKSTKDFRRIVPKLVLLLIPILYFVRPNILENFARNLRE